jgi:hypothetical protein
MTAVKLNLFGGMIPAQDDALLPEQNAAYSKGAWLYEGVLKGIWTPRLAYTASSSSVRKIFRIPKAGRGKANITDSYWLEFNDPDTDILTSPIASDAYDRHYWCSPILRPTYNTLARIQAGSAPYFLGIPAPSVAPTITFSTNSQPLDAGAGGFGITTFPATMIYGKVGGAQFEDQGGDTTVEPVLIVDGADGIPEARAYVYTWVSTFGEEGPPSPPVVDTGMVLGSWRIGVTAPTISDTTGRSLAFTNIYRTVTASDGTANYYFVAQIPIGTLTYLDVIDDSTVIGNDTLQSTGWVAPPDDLKGMVAMPNGFFAGFRNNEVFFSEPYRPHAWPVAYSIAVPDDIIGLGVTGQTLVIMTTATPAAATGVHPSSMSLQRMAAQEPCLSRGSIVSSEEGVFYASPNGVVVVSPGAGAQLITKGLLSRQFWQDTINVSELRSTRFNGAYFSFGAQLNGCFEPTAFAGTAFEETVYGGTTTGVLLETRDGRVAMQILATDAPVSSVQIDQWTTEIFIQKGQGFYWYDMSDARPRDPFIWRSKVYQAEKLKNFGAVRVFFTVPASLGVLSLASPPNHTLVQTLGSQQYLLLRVYAGGTLVATREIQKSGELIRLPSGFKEERWQFELEGRVVVTNFQVATTAEELRLV